MSIPLILSVMNPFINVTDYPKNLTEESKQFSRSCLFILKSYISNTLSS